jgi:hypothetical protein
MRSYSIQDMADQVTRICNEREIIVNYDSEEFDDPEGGLASIDLWEIWIPTVKTYRDYCTAMHEIGHILGEEPRSLDRMTRERNAWKWAEENALVWTDEAVEDARACLAYCEQEIAAGRLSATCELAEVVDVSED